MVVVRALQGGFPWALLRHYREEQGSGRRLGLLLLPGVGREPLHLHQVMLLPHSPLLRSILEGREEEQVALMLPGTDPATLQLLECLLYGGRSPAVTPAAHTALEDLCSSLGLGHWLQEGVAAEGEEEAEKNEEKAEEEVVQDAQRLVKTTSEQWLQEWVKDGTRTKAKKASANRHFVPPSAAPSTLKSAAPSTLKSALKSGGMTDCDTMPPPAGTPPPPGGEELDSTVVSTISEFLAKRELVAAGKVEGSGGEEGEVPRCRTEEEEEQKCHTEEEERAVWSVEYESVRGYEGTVPSAEVTVECDVGSGEEVESWGVGELEEMEEGQSMLKEENGFPLVPSGGMEVCAEPHMHTGGKKIPCRECRACRQEDCGRCDNCADKAKFGGGGVKKQSCRRKAACRRPYTRCTVCRRRVRAEPGAGGRYSLDTFVAIDTW